MYIKRTAESLFSPLPRKNKVIILLGARQVGKTTLIKNLFDSKKNFFLNFDIEIDKQRFLAAKNLTPSDAIKSFGNPDFLIIDEVQRLPETARIVKGWYDSGINTQVILLGSSSIDIVNQAVEALTGRNVKIYLPPLQFKEIITAQSWFSPIYDKSSLVENFHEQIQTNLLQSMIFGSYPEAVTTVNKRELLLALANDYLFKDVLQLGLIKSPDLIKKLLMLLAYQIGSEVSTNEIATSLGMSRSTVERYIHLLEQTFVIFKLPAFSSNPRKEISKNNKIYFWDTGIRNALLNDFSLNEFRTDIGMLWENWVISEIAKDNVQSGSKKNLYFWRTRAGSEVDLIIKEDDQLKAYEIKWADKAYRSKKAFYNAYKIEVEFITRNLRTNLSII